MSGRVVVLTDAQAEARPHLDNGSAWSCALGAAGALGMNCPVRSLSTRYGNLATLDTEAGPRYVRYLGPAEGAPAPVAH